MVRHATMEDISRIAEIIVFGKRMAYRTIFQNDYFSFNELQVMPIVDEFRTKPELIDNFLVYDDGIVRGVINRVNKEAETEICEFYVEPFFKRSGIGGELMRALVEEAKAEGKKRIFLWVIKENLPARSFYEKNGFVPTGEEMLIEGTDKLDMCYERILY